MMNKEEITSSYTRMSIVIRGAVQGVGFRPFIYRLAVELNLKGWVSNTTQGVFIEVEGDRSTLNSFIVRIEREKPRMSSIQSLEYSALDPVRYIDFEIKNSNTNGKSTALILPDIATCHDCLNEIFDPSNRRYLYPFTNCTNCGPRFSIIEELPYDRRNTTMKSFEMCDECRYEYDHPLDRRFHAQPNACSQCGPHLELWNSEGTSLAAHHNALLQAVERIRAGDIVAVKGLGGFHFVVDARNETAVRRLRERKHREEKPLALMYPSLQVVTDDCEVSELERRLLLSPESPIVLLKHVPHIAHRTFAIAESVAPNNPFLGIMLPYTPLHHILMRELGFPIVATSGNFSDEPICIDEHEALQQLHSIADVFLVHNRPIKRHVDDSIVRIMAARELVLRRARGFAPLPIQVKTACEIPLIAVGGHLKNTVAFTAGRNIFISQHIGDLETKEALEAFHHVIDDFKKMYEIHPSYLICDMHPDYLSTTYAKSGSMPVSEIQHHYAHVASCMAENRLDGQVLGVSWDGTGFGTDGTIWGGEFLLTDETSFRRVASMRTFCLPGGEMAIRETRRAALGLLFEVFGESVFDMSNLTFLRSFEKQELTLLRSMLIKSVYSPRTSSVGRLFDAVAALIGCRIKASFEGQAAMEMEFLMARASTEVRYEFRINESPILDPQSPLIVDWALLVNGILEDLKIGTQREIIAAKFHNTLAEIIVEVAHRVGEQRVVLSGGCFQNKYLTERTIRLLEEEGFRPYWHQRVPPNDGGISLGQMYAFIRQHQTQRQLQYQSRLEGVEQL
jgi:hydrogenase maturation protein HypF